jgi:hypothetical protein
MGKQYDWVKHAAQYSDELGGEPVDCINVWNGYERFDGQDDLLGVFKVTLADGTIKGLFQDCNDTWVDEWDDRYYDEKPYFDDSAMGGWSYWLNK